MQRFLYTPRAALRLVCAALLALLAFALLALCAPKAAATVPTEISDTVTITTDATIEQGTRVTSTGILIIEDGGSLTITIGSNLEIEQGSTPSGENPYGTGIVVVKSGGTLIVTDGSKITSGGSVLVKAGGVLDVTGTAGTAVDESIELNIEEGGVCRRMLGEFTVTARENIINDTDVAYANGVLTVLSGKAMTIANTNGISTPTTDAIVIGGSGDVTANLTLNGVNIERIDGVSLCSITSGSSLTLTLAADSENKLTHGFDAVKTAAGITVPSGASLTIASEAPSGTQAAGTLTAQGGAGSDGIGVAFDPQQQTFGGSVTILGGVVTAIGGAHNVDYMGDGIGCETITIKGDAAVSAWAGNDCALGSDRATVLIEGSATVAVESTSLKIGVKATSLTLQDDAKLTMAADCIVSGDNATITGNATLQVPIQIDDTLTISDNATATIQSTGNSAVYADKVVITDNAKVTAAGYYYGICANIAATIDGNATVNATGGAYDAGIGVRGGATLTIKGNASVTATGGFGSAGIYGASGSTIAIQENATVTATGGIGGAGIGSVGIVNIEGGTVTATGGAGGAGIGGTVSGATFVASGTDVYYLDETNGNAHSVFYWFDENGTSAAGCAVRITGGVVTATAGSGSITVWEIVFENGSVVSQIEKTYDNLQGEGIGNGYGGTDAGQFSTAGTGDAFIVTSSIADTSDKENWSGAIITPNQKNASAGYHASANPGTGVLYGSSYTLSSNAAIPAGYTLVLSSGQSLTIADGSTLLIKENGALVVAVGASYSGTVTTESGGQLIMLKAPAPDDNDDHDDSSATVTTPEVYAEAAPTSPATGECGVVAWLVGLLQKIAFLR